MLNSNREADAKPQKPKALRREYYYAKQGFKITMRQAYGLAAAEAGVAAGVAAGALPASLGVER
jgi:hypothetical protein